MVLTGDANLQARARCFRNHGITTDARQREEAMAWHYDMEFLGFNYRITDIQCALGISQMNKLPHSLLKRRELAAFYDAAFAGTPVAPLAVDENVQHAYHLYVVRVENRDRVFKEMRDRGVGVQVHYWPVHLHPYYQREQGCHEGMCPVAEKAKDEILSLPMFPTLPAEDAQRVVETLLSIVG